MSKRISNEQRILDFFRNSPIELAESWLRAAEYEVNSRRPSQGAPPKPKRGRKPRQTAEDRAIETAGSGRITIPA